MNTQIQIREPLSGGKDYKYNGHYTCTVLSVDGCAQNKTSAHRLCMSPKAACFVRAGGGPIATAGPSPRVSPIPR